MPTKYFAVKVTQTPHSNPFYLLSSSAADILKWAAVPRKESDFLDGYQRDLAIRHESIRDYLAQSGTNGKNVIPTSVLVAVDESRLSITPSKTSQGLFEIDIADPSPSVAGMEGDAKVSQMKALITKALSEIEHRLSAEELASIQSAKKQNDGVGREDGESVDDPPASQLALTARRLREALATLEQSGDAETLPEGLETYLTNTSKPGLILDGQHRVFGAKAVNAFNVHLPVVLLPGLSYAEQVFHFYMVNNKAQPLNKTQLRYIIATSLSKKEISELYERLTAAGVSTEEAHWTHSINTDAESPFVGLIDFQLKGGAAPIAENVAYQVVYKFINLGRNYRQLTSAVSEWGDDPERHWPYRISLFYALWRAVKNEYPNVWKKEVARTYVGSGPQLLSKVNLLVLQEFMLDQLNADEPRRTAHGEQPPFSNPTLLENAISLRLKALKEQFYTKPWQVKGLDTSTGRQFYKEQLSNAWVTQCAALGKKTLFKKTGT